MSDRIGFILGSGDLAYKALKNAIKTGLNVYVAAFEKIPGDIDYNGAKIEYFKLAEVGKIIDFFKKNSVKKVVLIGNVPHVNIFKLLTPDIRGAMFLMKLKDKTPKGIFKAIENEFLNEGIEIENSTRFLSDCLLKKGIICGRLTDDDIKQIEYGFRIAKNIASMDIGLTVIVKDYCVVAVEALEGTDACIKRAGDILGRNSGFIMIKVSRPEQDMRFDLPVIGSNTVLSVFRAGGRIIACESEKTLVADFDNMVRLAKDSNVTVYGI